MRDFKFFQKENKSLFARMSEQLQTATDRIPVPNDDIWTPQMNEIDNRVIRMVQGYFDYHPITFEETETLWMEITNHEISHYPLGDVHTLNVDVRMRNQPHSRIRYTLIRNEIGDIRILEKRSYNERF